jgi:hypothetical protein
MNLRRKAPPDSLYLLLDTLCNAFGGIILLAVLVVLLTSKEKSQSAGSTDSAEMLPRRLALAQTNLQQSLQLSGELHAKAGDARWQQQMALLSTRNELQDALQQTRDTAAQDRGELDTAGAADPAERLKFLNAELATAQAGKLAAQNRLAAASQNLVRLKQRQADLQAQVTTQLDALQRPLRLPREHETGKRVLYIIVRYGRIYPCHNLDSSRDETDIHWTTTPGEDTAEPIPGQGLDPEAAASYFGGLSNEDVYLVFLTFEDSFPAFLSAKQSAVSRGIAYGWEPFRPEDGPIIFSTSGHIPKPQ